MSKLVLVRSLADPTQIFLRPLSCWRWCWGKSLIGAHDFKTPNSNLSISVGRNNLRWSRFILVSCETLPDLRGKSSSCLSGRSLHLLFFFKEQQVLCERIASQRRSCFYNNCRWNIKWTLKTLVFYYGSVCYLLMEHGWFSHSWLLIITGNACLLSREFDCVLACVSFCTLAFVWCHLFLMCGWSGFPLLLLLGAPCCSVNKFRSAKRTSSVSTQMRC